jgi:hypothetical protein
VIWSIISIPPDRSATQIVHIVTLHAATK